MPSVIAFEPRRFESAASYYVEGRPRYSDLLIRRVAQFLRFDGTQKLLDLGTGPGLLAVAFAPFAGEVTAIDPEPEMLRIAAAQATAAGVHLTLLEGSSYTLSQHLGPFDLVTIGRAFHWMDRQATLETLDKLIRPGGAIALCATRQPHVPENQWTKDYDALRETHAEPNSPRKTIRGPDWLSHEAILLNSPFAALERISVIERRTTPLEQFVTRALSLSSSSPGRMGTNVDDFAQAIRDALSKSAVDGLIQEVVESEALLAFRSPP